MRGLARWTERYQALGLEVGELDLFIEMAGNALVLTESFQNICLASLSGFSHFFEWLAATVARVQITLITLIITLIITLCDNSVIICICVWMCVCVCVCVCVLLVQISGDAIERKERPPPVDTQQVTRIARITQITLITLVASCVCIFMLFIITYMI